jgi:LysW-gamma-L-lysine/LysW-L-ornithine aminotransferase
MNMNDTQAVEMEQNWMQIETQHDAGFTPKMPFTFVEGKGAKVTSDQGATFIDCTSAYGVMAVGYGNETIQKYLNDQLDKLTACHHLFSNDTRANFLEELMSVTPKGLDKAYLCNSGTEAVEAAIKVAVATTGRRKIVACTGGYHGLTLGSTGLNETAMLRAPFKSIINEAEFVERNNLDDLEAKIDDETAMFIVEPIQASNGGTIVDADFIRKARELTSKHGALLIIDEIATGFCRTGSWFATPEDVTPDGITIAKAFGGGLPFGALLLGAERAQKFAQSAYHSNTFGGNPLSMAAGLGALKFAKEANLCEQATQKGQVFLEGFPAAGEEAEVAGLKAIEGIERVHQKGLMIGIDFASKDPQFIQQVFGMLLQQQVLVIPRMGGIMLMPPLTIKEEEIKAVIQAIQNVMSQLS